METATLLYFLGASVALTITPGPDNLFVLTQGITCGRRQAIVTALGMCSGISVHTVAAAFGISALFYSSAAAFHAVKYAGALYLLYLAWKAIRERAATRPAADARPAAALFKRGFLMNVLNPKVAIFFLAFLPQFVTRETRHFPLWMLLLGFIFMAQAVVIFSLIGYFSGGIGGFLRSRPGIAKYLNGLTAGVFASLGVKLALAER